MPSSPSDVRRASARLNGLRTNGRVPDPAVELAARRDLGYHRVQREIRTYREDVAFLDPVHVGHLVALLVSGSDTEAVERFERAVREAVSGVPLTDADRERIAKLITGGTS